MVLLDDCYRYPFLSNSEFGNALPYDAKNTHGRFIGNGITFQKKILTLNLYNWVIFDNFDLKNFS